MTDTATPRHQHIETARQYLERRARDSFGNLAGFGQNIRQPIDAPLSLGGWFIRSLWVTPNIAFGECRINSAARFVGCPNPPSAYVIKCPKGTYRFRDYGRALIFAAIQAHRDAA
jgi:hypothetical protein